MSSDNNHKHPLPKRWIGCPIEADYFGDDRKMRKAERKMAVARDRSKYKKTDRRQREKQLKEAAGEHLERGRVLSIASQGIVVDANGESLICTLRGVLKKEKSRVKNLVVVGDFVLFERKGEGEGIIGQIEPRKTVLSRADSLSKRKEQLIAANIDQAIITASVISPQLKPSLIDRYIIAAKKGGMDAVVVINKVDLLDDPFQDPVIKEQEKIVCDELLAAYRGVDIPVIRISVESGEGLPFLKEAMKGKASVFSGQSGVGKSSLINAVTGKNLRIGGIVEKTKKGSHTTTTAQLITLEFGGWCIDTPGIKSFGIWDLDKEEIEHYFTEIFDCGHQCRFPDCSHLHETGCAVIAAVEKGGISTLRYESYAALMQDIGEDHFRR